MNQFGKAWQTVLQNSGLIACFGARDQATMDTVSKMAGVTEVLSRNRSVSIDHRTHEPHVSDSVSSVVRPVVHPHEVRGLGKDQMLLFCEGVPCVVKARRTPYTKECRGYGRNPYFRKSGFLSWLLK
jgi:type IV secretory pathway TraG/TraD family ATPase VirD4